MHRFPAALLIGVCSPGSASFRVAPDPAGAWSAGGVAPRDSSIRRLLHLPARLLPGALLAAGLHYVALLPRPMLTSALYHRLGRRDPAGRVPAPRPSGPQPSFTPSARVRSRGENNVMLADVMTKPQ